MFNVKRAILPLTLTVLSGLTGCIPSQKLAEGEMDRYWILAPSAEVPAGAPSQPSAGEAPGRFPTRWVIRQDPSLIRSTVSIMRAMDRMKAGTDEVEFAISPMYARAAADILAKARQALADLREMLASSDRGGSAQWADTLAGVLVGVESISRSVSTEQGSSTEHEAEPVGMAAGPVLELLARYVDAQSEESPLSTLAPGEAGRLRDALSRGLVKLGFEIAGREPPDGLAENVSRQMRDTRELERLRATLSGFLSQQIAEAPPSRGGAGKRKTVLTVLTYAPKALLMLESFLSQWDKVEGLRINLADRKGSGAVDVEVRVQDGREVRISRIMTGLPVIAFRGASRMSVLPDATEAGDTAVVFDPVGDGAVELRFEGLVYGLVRLFAFPLDSGPLRQVRVLSGRDAGGARLVNVAVLMESSADRKDPRRVLVVQAVRRRAIVRDVFFIRMVSGGSETAVSYLTPQRRYTYERIKAAELQPH